MSLDTLVEGVGLVICVLASLTLIGLPLKLGLQRLAGESIALPTPLLGMGVVVVSGWYWYGPFGGIRSFMMGLAMLGLGLAVYTTARTWLGWRNFLIVCVGRFRIAGAVGAGVGLVLLLVWGSLVSGPFLTNASGQNDIASYALLGQHVAEGDLDDVGPIEGYDTGRRSQGSFDFGPLAIIAATSIGPFNEVWRYQMALAAVAVGLIAYVLARLFDDLAPGHRALAELAGVAAVCPILLAYLWNNYFLNELLAISLVLGACVAIVRGSSRPTLATRVAHGLAAGVVIAGLLASYPHMALAGPLVFIPALFVADGVSRAGPRIVALVLQGVGALIAAAILLPTPAWRLPGTLRVLGGVEAGWSLPGFVPSEILGFVSTMNPQHESPLEWLPSVAMLAVVLTSCVWIVRSKGAPALGRFGVVVFVLSLVSYWYVFESQGGPSYRQWKWITFFTPVLAGTAVVVVTVAISSSLARFTRASQRIALAAGVAYCVLVTSNAGAVDFSVGSRSAFVLSADLVHLGDSPALDGIDQLNISVGPYWETMWAAYFLRDRETLRLQQPTYYAVSPAEPGWTLQRRDAPTEGALEVREVNGTYALVRR